MNLYTFAHRGEAQIFLEQHKLKPIPFVFDGLYLLEVGPMQGHALLITNEGPIQALTKLTAVLAAASQLNLTRIEKVINLGVAGALRQSVSKNEIYAIRTAYLSSLDKIEYTSFTHQISYQFADCVTATERITSPEKASKLAPVAAIVDRELWGLSKAAKTFSIPLESYKLISDEAYQQTDFCQTTLEEASQFSEKLWQFTIQQNYFFNSKIASNENPYEQFSEQLGHDFYFTLTQKRQLVTLLSKLQKFPTKELLNELIEIKTTPKKRAQYLLEALHQELNPFIYKTKEQLETLLHPFRQLGHHPHYDPQLEKAELKLTVNLANEEEALLLAKALKQFSFSNLKKIFDGEDLHV